MPGIEIQKMWWKQKAATWRYSCCTCGAGSPSIPAVGLRTLLCKFMDSPVWAPCIQTLEPHKLHSLLGCSWDLVLFTTGFILWQAIFMPVRETVSVVINPVGSS